MWGMTRPSFSKRGSHSESSLAHPHPIYGAWWRQPADRRHRLPLRKGAGCRWSYVLFSGLSLVIFSFFALGAWQVSLTASVGGPLEFASLNGLDGRRPGSVLRFVPSDLLQRFEQRRGALERLRSERRLGVRPPRLALVIKDTYRDSSTLMLLTLVRSLIELGYALTVVMLENGRAHSAWQSVGCQVSVLGSEGLTSVDWSNFEGVIVNSIEGMMVVPSLMEEPFVSVPLVWLVHEDILGKRLSHYAEMGWQDLISKWRNAFNRADVVAFPDVSLPMLYTSLDKGNFFVISGSPVDMWANNDYISNHSRIQLRKDYGFSDNDLLILVIGSFAFYDEVPLECSRMHPLLPQIKRIKNIAETIKIVFLCENSADVYTSDAQKAVKRMGSQDGFVKYYGLDHDLKSFMLMSDIVLYGLFEEEKYFPPLLLLAMSFGIPIVAPNLTVIDKYVIDKVHVVLFNPNIPYTLVRAFSSLIEDKNLSNLAASVALQGKLLSMNILASECITHYAELIESIIQFPSDTILPNSTSQIQQKGWLWELLDNINIQTSNLTENENLSILVHHRQSSSIVYLLEEQYSQKFMENKSQPENGAYTEEYPTLSDWEDIDEMKAFEDFESREMEEIDERMERTLGSWEDVYSNSRKADKQKAGTYVRDEVELLRIGQHLCIYEVYTGDGAWPFVHHGSIYRGITLSDTAQRSNSDDVNAASRLLVLNDSYYRDLLCETGAMFAIANRVDGIHMLPWIGFQSWRAAGRKASLSHTAEKLLEDTIYSESYPDAIYYWAVMDKDLNNIDTNRKHDFWSMCDSLNAAQCRVVFENAFRQMYGLPPEMTALPPMPLDGDHWSVLHSWVMPTPSFLEFIMFARIFADSLHSLNRNSSNSPSCVLGSSSLERRHCYCRVLEILVNVWAYHSARRMVYLDPVTGELHEQHPVELREMWVKYFDSSLLKSMDEDLAEEAEDRMHPSGKWLWPSTGEVYWPGTFDREREERYKQKMDKKRKLKEKLLDRQKHGYKQKSLGQK